MRIVLVLTYLLIPAAVIAVAIRSYAPDPAIVSCRGRISAASLQYGPDAALPPPTELQQPVAAVTRIFRRCRDRIQADGVETVLPYLNTTLAVIEAEYGRNSVIFANGLTQIIKILLSTERRFDAARPYTEMRVAVSRKVYGPAHRQTARDLQFHADVLIALSAHGYADEAIKLLRETADISGRVMGPDHGETMEAEAALAGVLFRKWQYADDRNSQAHLLDEAEALAARLAALYAQGGAMLYGEQRMMALLGRIAHAREDHVKAVGWFSGALSADGSAGRIHCGTTFQYDEEQACADYADSLRKLGRKDEAAAVRTALDNARKETEPAGEESRH